jgi:hypothetical protein
MNNAIHRRPRTFGALIAPLVAAALIASGSGAFAQDSMSSMGQAEHGLPAGGDGPTYSGAPDLDATAALAMAGGGTKDFSIQKALVAMVGASTVDAEVAKLTKQYGKANVTSWVTVFDFAVDTAAADATKAGVKFPTPPSDLQGKALAVRLVQDGAGDGTFWTGTMLDHVVTHGIHEATMSAIDAKFGEKADENYHRITDQAMYDLAQALGAKSVKLASLH